MTFDPNVPNASQSPGVFPTQNNTNFTRLKTIINADHVFNDTAQSTDGVHRQVTLINRSSPGSLPAGTSGILYSKLDTNSQTQLNFYNGTLNFQITPTFTVLSGTVTVNNSTYTDFVLVPANAFGDIFLWKGNLIQRGTFISDATKAYAFPCVQNTVGSGNIHMLFLSQNGGGTVNLNLRALSLNSSFTGVWSFKVFYRSTT